MSSAICTLFEGHYHIGLAGITNSLYRNGYRGSIFVGFRGDLPPWAKGALNDSSLYWPGAMTMIVSEGLQLHFMPISTDSHFANFKPDFMMKLWDGPARDVKNMFYFDPDIVIVKSWSLFDEWVTCGIALCEDVNSPFLEFHPRRVAWRRYFNENGIELTYKESIYVNSGFIGITFDNKNFLNSWKKSLEIIAPLTGGLDLSIFKHKDHLQLEQIGGPFKPFLFTDQDALNIAIEKTNYQISYIGKTAMGFEVGFNIMEHAIGSPKPWKWKIFRQSLDGKPPRNVDIEFWKYIDSPIRCFSKNNIFIKRLGMYLARGLGRFYKSN